MKFICINCKTYYSGNGDIPEFMCNCGGKKFKKIIGGS